MELILRLLHSLNVIFGWILSPIYALSHVPKRRLGRLKEPEILSSSATVLAEKIRTKWFSSEQVVSAFIERCQQVNGRLNAIIEDRFNDALEEARNIDRMIRSNVKSVEEMEKDTPLLGVPITVKESCKVKGKRF